jgi:hypothetical protein
MRHRSILAVASSLIGCTCGSYAAPDASTDDAVVADTASDSVATLDVEDAAGNPCAASAAVGDVIGCDYAAIWPSGMDTNAPISGCLAAVVINPTSATLTLSVTFQGSADTLPFHSAAITGQGRAASYTPLNAGDQVAGNSAALIALAEYYSGDDVINPTCIIPPIVGSANNGQVAAPPNATASAFRIQTSLPAIVYEVWWYTPNDSDNGVVVPLRDTSSWANSYVDVGTYLPGCDAAGAEAPLGNAWTAAVANRYNTTVSMPSAQNGTVAATLAPFELLNVARCNEFVGQSVTAGVPYSLWAGTAGMQLPWYPDCVPTTNMPFLEIPQVSDWGHTYAFARQDNRPPATGERTFIRVVAAADGTMLSYSPVAPTGAPTLLNHGDVGSFWSYDPFVIASQDAGHPVFVLAHMVDPRDFDPSCSYVDASASSPYQSAEGSNAMHAVPPVEHWGMRYDMFLPFNYPASQLVVVRAIGGPDVMLDCAGAVVGWAPIDANYEYARVWISRDTGGVFNSQLYPAGTCDNGVHVITSSAPFGVTAYGWISSPFATYVDASAAATFGSSYAYAPITSHATIVPVDGGAN